MTKTVAVLGSTGSIGRQSLDVIAACGMRAAALTANRSVRELEEQARRFRPELAVLMEEDAAADLKVRLADTGVRVAAGMEGLLEAASLPGADTVLTASTENPTIIINERNGGFKSKYCHSHNINAYSPHIIRRRTAVPQHHS